MLTEVGPTRPRFPVTRLPTTTALPGSPLNSIRVRPTTYTVSVYILVTVLVLEGVMVLSVFWLRSMVVPVNFVPPKHRPIVVVPPPTVVQPPSGVPEVPNLAVSSARTLLALPNANDKQSKISDLLDQARALRRQASQAPIQTDSQGYLKGSVDVLIRAEDLDPRNPDVLQGLAEVDDLLNDSVRSKIYWQRLVDLGPAVGKAYSLARDHVLLLNSTPDSDPLQGTSVLSREIYIVSVEKTPVDTEAGAPMFKLKVTLAKKDRAMAGFDQKKLQPFVIFYENTGDASAAPTSDSLKPDLRPHKGGFEDLFLFQDHHEKETMTVEYTLPVPGAPGPDGKPMGDYYGFVIGIYYDKALQDVRSEPADLITRLPLPDGIE